MSRNRKDRHPIALAERTVMEALRVFARHDPREGHRHAPSPLVRASGDHQLIAMVDEHTLTAEPAARAVLVYEPGRMLLDMMRFDVSAEEWAQCALPATAPENDAPCTAMRVGAMSGGVLVALATADCPEGKLSRIRVLVTPNFRQRGLGHLVLHRAVQALLQEGLLPYARLTTMDLGARALARAAGFVNVTRSLTAISQLAPL